MSAVVRPLACQDDAARVATTDRDAQADLVLSIAVQTAIVLMRAGRPGRARYELARAEVSASRILGEAVSS